MNMYKATLLVVLKVLKFTLISHYLYTYHTKYINISH